MPLPIRVLHLADVINRYDFIDNVLRFCDRTRFRMMACTFTDASNIQPPTYRDVPWHILRVSGRGSYPRAVAVLAAILRRERVDIVHTHHFDPTAIGVTAALVARCRAIIGRHYSDNIHRLRARWTRAAYLRTEAIFNRLAARIVVPSRRIHEILTCTQGVAARKVIQIPYGFDLTKYVASVEGRARVRREFKAAAHPLLGSFGRLHQEKGQIYLLRALRALIPVRPELRLLLVGTGPDRQLLENAVRELGLAKHVIFTGWRTDVVDILAGVDIVVQPSCYGEAFSQAMVEALAMGKPLVMSDVSGVRDVVRHGVNGLVVPPADAAGLAVAIQMLVENPQLAHQLGEAGRLHIVQHFDIRSVVRRYEDCYESVFAESRAA